MVTLHRLADPRTDSQICGRYPRRADAFPTSCAPFSRCLPPQQPEGLWSACLHTHYRVRKSGAGLMQFTILPDANRIKVDFVCLIQGKCLHTQNSFCRSWNSCLDLGDAAQCRAERKVVCFGLTLDEAARTIGGCGRERRDHRTQPADQLLRASEGGHKKET